MTESREKCEVREGRFIDPCDTLAKATDINQPSFSKSKGLFRAELFDRVKMEQSRSYHGVRTKAFDKGGILFNYCPFCGVQIDAPFTSEDEAND